MQYTTNFNLKKPEGSDVVNIDDLNYNADIIDTKLGSHNSEIADARGGFDTLREKLDSYAVNVKDFGAKGDGVTDDTSAIQNAINNAYAQNAIIFIPGGNYLLKSPINLTNKDKLTIIGAGPNNTILIGNTGSIVFDLTGAINANISNLKVSNRGTSNPSTIAFLFARSQSNQFAEFNNLNNIYVDFSSIPTANNGNGTIGIYNYGAELWKAYNIFVIADMPVIFSNSNIYNINSYFTTIFSDITSMSHAKIYSSTLHANIGPALTYFGAWFCSVSDTYLSTTVNNTYNYAIRIFGDSRNVEYTGNIETFKSAVVIDNATITGLKIFANHVSTGSPQIVLDASTSYCVLNGPSKIEIKDTRGDVNHYLIDYTGSKGAAANFAEIYLQGNQQLRIPNESRELLIYNTGDQPITLAGPTSRSGIVLGRTKINIIGEPQTTATAGSASALPATPAGYLQMQLNGSDIVIPYYKP